ncbi:hypothetical protein AB0F93_24365, partial [Micromonospora tulbaghiae]
MGRVARTPSPRLPAARRPRLVTVVLAVVALTGTTAASCGDDAPAVAVAEVGRAPVSEVIDAPATVTARAAATLTAPADSMDLERRRGITIRAAVTSITIGDLSINLLD